MRPEKSRLQAEHLPIATLGTSRSAGRAVRPRKPRPRPERPPIAARGASRRAELVLRLTAFRCLQRAVHPWGGERPAMPGGGRSRGPKVGCGSVGAVSLVSACWREPRGACGRFWAAACVWPPSRRARVAALEQRYGTTLAGVQGFCLVEP